jgi:AraC-like DNA-binding protein
MPHAVNGAPETAPTPYRRLTLTTSDPDEAHAHLRTTYADHSVRLSGNVSEFRFRHDIIDGGGFSVANYHHSMRCSVRTVPMEQVIVGQMIGGRLDVLAGREQLRPDVGEVFLFPPSVGLAVEWDDFRAGLVGLELRVLERVAVEMFGAPALRGVRFEAHHLAVPDRVRHWQGLVRYLYRDVLLSPFAARSPLIHSQVTRLLAATVLETFPNTAGAGRPENPGLADAGAVRRAMAFIEERAGDPITLTDIADAARLSPRALQAAFRRHLDTSPMAHLRSVRMEGAHRDLLEAQPVAGFTVARIAARWGFAHHGRFSAQYRARYGRPPSQAAGG